jgi:hypothetical protein
MLIPRHHGDAAATTSRTGNLSQSEILWESEFGI